MNFKSVIIELMAESARTVLSFIQNSPLKVNTIMTMKDETF